MPSIGGARRRLTRRWRYLRRPDAVNFNGVTLELGPWAAEAVRKGLYDGWYEWREREVLQRTLRPEDIVLEIGCGMGYITTIAAGMAREVRSFDANPELVPVALATVERNGRSATIRNGVLDRAARAETVPFYVETAFPGSSLRPTDGARRIDVPVLDFARECAGCTYLICDIEGQEVELLAGELPGIRAICVETHPEATTQQQISAMLDALSAQGFTLDRSACQEDVLFLVREV